MDEFVAWPDEPGVGIEQIDEQDMACGTYFIGTGVKPDEKCKCRVGRLWDHLR